MNDLAEEIKKFMIVSLPDRYQNQLFPIIPIKQIVYQILMECCEYAYSVNAPKSSLWSYMKQQSLETTGETEIDSSIRMRLQRDAAERNQQMAALSKYALETSNTRLKDVAFPKSDDHYSITSLDYMEMCQMGEIYLWKVVLKRQFVSPKFYNEEFRTCSQNYEDAVSKMKKTFFSRETEKEKRVLNGLAFFGMEYNLYFDFLYEIAANMESAGVKSIPEMESRITAFCYQPTIKSVLAYDKNWRFLSELTTSSRAVNIRRSFISDIATSPENSDYKFRQAIYLETLFLIAFFQAALQYEGLPLREWFVHNADYDDMISVMEEYGVFNSFVANKYWSNKRIRYAKAIYSAMTFDYKNIK